MQGLMTLNRLLSTLMDEVKVFSDKQKIILEQKQKVAEITNKFHWTKVSQTIINDPEEKKCIDEVRTQHLPEQIRLYKEVHENLDKIERVVKLLESDTVKKRIAKRPSEEYNLLMGVLGDVKKIFKPGIGKKGMLQILEKQQTNLEKCDLKGFSLLLEKEASLLSKAVPGIASEQVMQKIKDFNKLGRSIRKRRLTALCLSIVLMVLNVYSDTKRAVNLSDYVNKVLPNHEFIIDKTGKPIILDTLIMKYICNDFQKECEAEKEIEKLTGFNVVGDYTIEELNLLNNDIITVYGSEYIKRLHLQNVVFVPSRIYLIKKSESGELELDYTHGLAHLYFDQVTLATHADEDLKEFSGFVWQDFFRTVLYHEFAHTFLSWLREKEEFEMKWNEIKGGSFILKQEVRQTEGEYFGEQVACSVSYLIRFLINNRSNQLNPNITKSYLLSLDGKVDAMKARIKLLMDYGFLPGKEDPGGSFINLYQEAQKMLKHFDDYHVLNINKASAEK